MASPSTKRAPTFIFAGGGTGGHLFPALAVADALDRAVPEARLLFFASSRAIDRSILERTAWDWHPQPVQPIRINPRHWAGFLRAWRDSMRQCAALFDRCRPSVVVGSGGYVSVPPLLTAHRMGIPIAILNPDAIPGKATRFLASKASRIFVQWEETCSQFKRRPGIVVAGCPTRGQMLEAGREAGIREFDLDPSRKTLLFTGASLGARSVNDAVVGALPVLRNENRWQIIHLTGETDCGRIQTAYNQLGILSRVLAFTERMPLAMAAADLIVSRAGASTLAEITALGRASILMPYPYHRDMHQLANARVLERAGAARIVMDRKNGSENLTPLLDCMIPLMRDDELRVRMGHNARQVGKPNAAASIAQALLEMADDVSAK